MFELLMGLPLFRGATRQRMAEVVGNARFHFIKYAADDVIVSSGQECTHLIFIIDGSVRNTVHNDNGRFAVSYILNAPAVVAPDFVFGPSTRYPCDTVALSTVSVLRISKADFIKILMSDTVFLFNYLNTLSVSAQKSINGLMSLASGALHERIACWIIAMTPPESTSIRFGCSGRELCSLFNVSQDMFESVCRMMEEKELILYTGREIIIKDRRALLSLLQCRQEGTADSLQ